ncbi:flagellar motor switch protein M [Aquicoccus sp. SCR17]|nr:flagellar motor switch protein M [Carideicomes alvinocaridis]
MASVADGGSANGRSFGGVVGLVLGLLLLCALGLAGGVALALGPGRALALLTGATDQATAPAAEEAGHGDSPAAAGHGGGDHAGATTANEMAVTPFKEIIVNISATTASGRKTTRFMKLNLAMVYDDHAEGAERIEARRLYLRDSFQDYLRQLTERDLQGSEGLVTLKAELLRRARAITDSEAPQEMLISDLIVQ